MDANWNDKAARRVIQERARKRLKLVGEYVEGAVKLRTPVGKIAGGNLRGSITHKVVKWDTVRIGTGVEYAPYVELGTRYMAPRAYLRGGLRSSYREIKIILGAK